jgi:hypothetical protein
MEKYRVIGTSPADGSLNSETIIFLDPSEKDPAYDWCPSGHTVYMDEIILADLPDMFPVGHTFSR